MTEIEKFEHPRQMSHNGRLEDFILKSDYDALLSLARKQAQELEKMPKWIAVEQELPKHGGQVLVSWSFLNQTSGSRPFVSAARYEMGHWDWNSPIANNQRDRLIVAAWQNMPDPLLLTPPSTEGTPDGK